MSLAALIFNNSSSRHCRKCASLFGRKLSLITDNTASIGGFNNDSSRILPKILPEQIEEPIVIKSYSPESELKHCDNLLQFFEPKVFWGRNLVGKCRSGQSWSIEALRLKSNTDLHKLWYVLLKERNLLLTLDTECEKTDRTTPNDDRIEKVERSMENILQVVEERNEAYKSLEEGRGRPQGAYTWSLFGFRYWKVFKEHSVPWWENEKFKLDNIGYRDYVIPWMRLRLERRRMKEFAKDKYFAYKTRQSLRNYPDLPVATPLKQVEDPRQKRFNLHNYMRIRRSEMKSPE